MFNKDNHEYVYNNEIIPSVTRIIDTIMGNNYGNVPLSILNKAKERGTIVHKRIEMFELIGFKYLDDEDFLKYYKLKRELKFKIKEPEVKMLFETPYGNYAGTADLVGDIIYDIKTCYKLDIERTTMQLSLYSYKRPIKEGGIIWIPKKKEAELKKVTLMSDDEVEEIIAKFYKKEYNAKT